MTPPVPRRRPHYALAQCLISLFTRLLLGCRVEGNEHLPRAGGFLLAANHKSYLDPPLVGGFADRELCYFAKRQLFAIPLFSRAIRAFGAVPVDREGADRRAIATALAIVGRGDGLLVFPEGTRIRRPGLAEPKAGIGMLAVRSGAPVVPCFIAGSWEPRRNLFRRIPVLIRFGPPLSFGSAAEGSARGRYLEAAREIMAAIGRLAPEGSLGAPPSASPELENPD